MTLRNARVTYERAEDGIFTAFTGYTYDVGLDVNGVGGQLGDIDGGKVRFYLRTPRSNWPGEVQDGAKYLELISSAPATWGQGEVQIEPAADGKWRAVFDHDNGGVHVLGALAVKGESSSNAWLSTGGDLPFDARTSSMARSNGDIAVVDASDIELQFEAGHWNNPVEAFTAFGPMTVELQVGPELQTHALADGFAYSDAIVTDIDAAVVGTASLREDLEYQGAGVRLQATRATVALALTDHPLAGGDVGSRWPFTGTLERSRVSQSRTVVVDGSAVLDSDDPRAGGTVVDFSDNRVYATEQYHYRSVRSLGDWFVVLPRTRCHEKLGLGNIATYVGIFWNLETDTIEFEKRGQSYYCKSDRGITPHETNEQYTTVTFYDNATVLNTLDPNSFSALLMPHEGRVNVTY